MITYIYIYIYIYIYYIKPTVHGMTKTISDNVTQPVYVYITNT